MIFSILIQVFNAFLSFLISFLPTGHLPSAIASSFAYFVGVANAFSYVVPVDTLLQAVAVMLVFDGAILAWHFINWIIRKIPGMQ